MQTSTARISTAALRLALAVAVTLLAACSSTKTLYGQNRGQLASASESMEAGEYQAARTKLEWLLISTREEAGTYAAQRYWAAFLLARLNLEAGLRAPFLTEPRLTGRATRQEPSWVAHFVLASYAAAYAADWGAAAERAPQALDGQELLPPELADYGYDTTLEYLDLGSLLVLGRLLFDADVTSLLRSRPELLDLERCEALFEETRMTPAARPWILWVVHQYLRTRDEPLAYKFGIRARELGRDVAGAFPQSAGDEIAGWILNDSKYVFVSSGKQLFDPGTDYCSTSGDANVDFSPVLKTEYTAP